MATATDHEIFIPLWQQTGWNQVYFHVRTNATLDAVLTAVRSAIAQLDPDQPIYFVRTLDQLQDDDRLEQRGAMMVLGLIGLVALSLVLVGLYGVTAYAVTSRTREIGVRIAVGARREQVVGLVLRQVLATVGVGAAVGIGLVLAAGGTMRHLLFNVAPTDPASLGGAAALLVIGAVMCAAHPAWRAANIDPTRALRSE